MKLNKSQIIRVMIAGTLLLVGMENKSMSLSYEEENKTNTTSINIQESKKDLGNPAPHLYAVGNAHIDLAWQWRWRETIETASEIFTNALNLMKQNPDFIFAQDQAALYEGIEQLYPKVFERIRKAVLSGQWQVVGGKWCESTMELANEESTIRQYLYGTRYFKDRFGISVDTDWEVEGSQFLPTFSQVMAQAGIRYAVLGRSPQFHILRLVLGKDEILYIGVSIAGPFVNYLAIYRVFGGDVAAPGKLFAGISYASIGFFFILIPLFGWLGVRIGKRNSLFVGFMFAIIGCMASWWLIMPGHPWLLIVFVLLIIPANVAAAIFPQAILADTVDLDELRTGRRREGIYSAVYAFLMKLIGSSTVLLTGFCLHWIGFDEKATVQTESSMFKMRLALLALPIISVVLASLLLWFYPLDAKKVKRIRTILEKRRLHQRNNAPQPANEEISSDVAPCIELSEAKAESE